MKSTGTGQSEHAWNLPFQYLSIKRIVVILLLSFFISNNSNKAQNLLTSRQTSYYSYIYHITNREAESIYKRKNWKATPEFLHTLVDSFPTDSGYRKNLSPGHYLKVHVDKNNLNFAITTIQNFDVFILNNNTDLCVQLTDLEGNIICDADVYAGCKKLRYHKKTQTYVDKKSNRNGWLKVTCQGLTCFYDLERDQFNPLVKRGSVNLLYGTPLAYAWRPLNYVLRLPLDAVRSIVYLTPTGTIRRTGFFMRQSFEKVACIFDDFYCESYPNDHFSRKYKGYMVFNKPRYMPDDTVKFKAYLVSSKGKPVNREMKVVLYNYGKETILTKLSPYGKGGYEYQFYLHDTLKLRLDQYYTVQLVKNKRKTYIQSKFKYEDYELKKNELNLQLDQTEQYKGQDLVFHVSGTDENDLFLQDARISVTLVTERVEAFFNKQVFVPDTLFRLEKKLNPSEPTEVIVPDSIFPHANLDYKIFVSLFTSDNEKINADKSVKYRFREEKVHFNTEGDSVTVHITRDGKPNEGSVKIYAFDNFGNGTLVFTGISPCTIKLNPFYSRYLVKSVSKNEYFELASESSQLSCTAERNNTGLNIVIDNPGKLQFTYQIFRKNRQVQSGSGVSLNTRIRSRSKENYYISLQYIWGGKTSVENYQIPLLDKKLNIAVTQPRLVFRDKSYTGLLVTDQKVNRLKEPIYWLFNTKKIRLFSALIFPTWVKPEGQKN
ncbi:MAG: hypothetical protein U0T82_09730 [Bacteroidales bacterium]